MCACAHGELECRYGRALSAHFSFLALPAPPSGAVIDGCVWEPGPVEAGLLLFVRVTFLSRDRFAKAKRLEFSASVRLLRLDSV